MRPPLHLHDSVELLQPSHRFLCLSPTLHSPEEPGPSGAAVLRTGLCAPAGTRPSRGQRDNTLARLWAVSCAFRVPLLPLLRENVSAPSPGHGPPSVSVLQARGPAAQVRTSPLPVKADYPGGLQQQCLWDVKVLWLDCSLGVIRFTTGWAVVVWGCGQSRGRWPQAGLLLGPRPEPSWAAPSDPAHPIPSLHRLSQRPP